MIKSPELVAFIGPSAAGKSTIIEKLCEDKIIELTPTWTDRPKRKDEDSLEHVFVSSAEIAAKQAQGFFVHEPLTFFGLPYQYALPKIDTTKVRAIPAIMMRASVAKLVKKYYPQAVIYQIEAPKDRVAEMLQKRVAEGASLGSRLDDYDNEIRVGRALADRCFMNEHIDAVYAQIKQALADDFTNNA